MVSENKKKLSSIELQALMTSFSKQEDEAFNPLSADEETPFSRMQRLGKEKRWVEIAQTDVVHRFTAKSGQLMTSKVFIRQEVDNARFQAGLYPFFGDQYLWTKEDTKPWIDKATGQQAKCCPSGVGNDELFYAMVENNEVDKFLSKEGFSQDLLDEFVEAEKNNFRV